MIQQAIIMPLLSVLMLAMMTMARMPATAAISCRDAVKQCNTDDECLSRYYFTLGYCVKERKKSKKCRENSRCAKEAKKLKAHPKGQLFHARRARARWAFVR